MLVNGIPNNNVAMEREVSNQLGYRAAVLCGCLRIKLERKCTKWMSEKSRYGMDTLSISSTTYLYILVVNRGVGILLKNSLSVAHAACTVVSGGRAKALVLQSNTRRS